MKGEEEAIYSRYAAECPDLPEIAKKIVFLEERQPAIDKFAAGVFAMLQSQHDITLTHQPYLLVFLIHAKNKWIFRTHTMS